jgi:hypothetical protein
VTSRTGDRTEAGSHELEIGSEAKGVIEVGGARVRAVALEPHPTANIPTDSGAYRLVLRLEEPKAEAR